MVAASSCVAGADMRLATAMLAALFALCTQAAAQPTPSTAVGERPDFSGHVVELDRRQLERAKRDYANGRVPPPLTLPLRIGPQGESQTVLFSSWAPALDGFSLSGKLQGDPASMVVFVVDGATVMGMVWTRGRLFSIRPDGRGAYRVEPVPPPVLNEPRQLPLGDVQATTEDGDDGDPVDIFVLWSRQSRLNRFALDELQAMASRMVAVTNAILADSGSSARLNLVGATEYAVGAEDKEEARQDLRNSRVVEDLRTSYAADLVHLIGTEFDGGIAEVRSWISVSQTHDLVFAHEVGHNLGLLHDRYEEAKENTDLTGFGFGYVNARAFDAGAPESWRWRTLMAYNDECSERGGFHCQLLPRFSNPRQVWRNHAMGVWNEADGRRAIDAFADTAANWRQSDTRCEFTLSRDLVDVSPAGGNATVEVDVRVPKGASCPWSATTGESFLSLRRFSDKVIVRATRHVARGSRVREGLVSIAGKPVLVRQRESLELSFDVDGTASVREGETVALPVVLSRARDVPTAFRWGVERHSERSLPAADERDYAVRGGVGELPAGVTAASIEIPIRDDDAIEPPREWFDVRLSLNESGPETPALGDSVASVVVLEGVCDRSPAIEAALTPVRGDCSAATAHTLSSRRSLRLRGRGIDALRRDDLLGMENLRVLDLSGNELATLPPGVFRENGELQAVSVAENRLASFPAEPLPALLELDLSGNAIETLPSDWLGPHWPRLRDLRLGRNGIAELPSGFFRTDANLRSVWLDGNPGAPFALQVALRRTDGDPWAAGPVARLRAHVREGAPFPIDVALSAPGGKLTLASGARVERLAIAAGQVESAAFRAEKAAGGLRIDVVARSRPPRCYAGEGACWRGIEVAAEPLVLFVRSPRPLALPAPASLFGEDLRLPLASLIVEGNEPLSWSAVSSDDALASAQLLDGHLLVQPQVGVEGVVQVTVTATDALGQRASVVLDVAVEFHWPKPAWRVTIGSPGSGSGENEDD